MATLRFTPVALSDLERLAKFLRESDAAAAAETLPLILNALRVLASYPLIGRPLEGSTRELLVFRGRSGYVAQYAYHAPSDEVVVLAVRHQREVD